MNALWKNGQQDKIKHTPVLALFKNNNLYTTAPKTGHVLNDILKIKTL
jgi:hypothetical protein